MFAESIVRDLKHMERGQHEVTGKAQSTDIYILIELLI